VTVFFAHAKVAGGLTLKPNLALLGMEFVASYLNPRLNASEGGKAISYQQKITVLRKSSVVTAHRQDSAT
jgi:hypothetical protein